MNSKLKKTLSQSLIPSAPATAAVNARPLYEDISARARALWEGYGKPSGRDEEIWLEAERQLLGTDSRVTSLDGGDAGSVATKDYKESVDAPASRIKTPSGDNERVPAEFLPVSAGQTTHGGLRNIG